MQKDLAWMSQPFAHRGLHDVGKGVVENTRSAIKVALDHQFGFEVDLQQASCGNIMVFHDNHLERLTHATGLVSNKTMNELQLVEFRDTSDKMMNLQELLELNGARVPMLLEIKSDRQLDGGRIEAFIRSIIDHLRDYRGDYAVMSFDPRLISTYRKLAPTVPRGLISEQFGNKDDWPQLSLLERLRARFLLSFPHTCPDFIAYDIEALPALAPLIARELFKKPLLTWTVRTDTQQVRAKKYCDAMIFEGFTPKSSPINSSS